MLTWSQGAAPFHPEVFTSANNDPNPAADAFGDHASTGDLDANAHNDCAGRWRNAGPESRKKMFALFSISGIFLVVCRHGHVLFVCDMIRSGELYVATLHRCENLM
jgi:hypothetical protein